MHVPSPGSPLEGGSVTPWKRYWMLNPMPRVDIGTHTVWGLIDIVDGMALVGSGLYFLRKPSFTSLLMVSSPFFWQKESRQSLSRWDSGTD